MENTEPEKTDKSHYEEDIRTIKELMLRTENEPVYENWAFYSWGLILIAASLIHYFIERAYHYNIGELFLRVWVPTIAIMGLIETVSLVRNLEKNSLTIFSKKIVRLYLTIFGLSIIYIFIILLFIKLGGVQYLPIVLMLVAASFYFIFAIEGYRNAYLHGYILLAIAVVLYLLKIDHRVMVVIVGTVIGTSTILIGIAADINIKKRL